MYIEWRKYIPLATKIENGPQKCECHITQVATALNHVITFISSKGIPLVANWPIQYNTSLFFTMRTNFHQYNPKTAWNLGQPSDMGTPDNQSPQLNSMTSLCHNALCILIIQLDWFLYICSFFHSLLYLQHTVLMWHLVLIRKHSLSFFSSFLASCAVHANKNMTISV